MLLNSHGEARWNIRKQFALMCTTAHQYPCPVRWWFGTLRSLLMPTIGFHDIVTIILFWWQSQNLGCFWMTSQLFRLCWWQHKSSQNTIAAILSKQAQDGRHWSLPPVLFFRCWMINLSVNCETCLMFYPFPRTCLLKVQPMQWNCALSAAMQGETLQVESQTFLSWVHFHRGSVLKCSTLMKFSPGLAYDEPQRSLPKKPLSREAQWVIPKDHCSAPQKQRSGYENRSLNDKMRPVRSLSKQPHSSSSKSHRYRGTGDLGCLHCLGLCLLPGAHNAMCSKNCIVPHQQLLKANSISHSANGSWSNSSKNI